MYRSNSKNKEALNRLNLERTIVLTADGSTTIRLKEWDEQYHSMHGAIQEALHVFIKQGLQLFSNRELRVMEIGFGTGLNAFISYLEATSRNLIIDYIGIEGYPVKQNEIDHLNYVSELKADKLAEVFETFHSCDWEKKKSISDNFSLTKRQQFFQDINDKASFDLIYFDAFGARVQPELWTEPIFRKMYIALKSGGVLVTYSAKGSVRRAMQTVGFKVEKLPGPPGKREMLRAIKPK